MKLLTSIKSILMTMALVSLSTLAHADLEKKSEDMCVKIKTCGMQQMKDKGMPEEALEQMSGMFEGMCKAQLKPFIQSADDAGLEKKANACIDSMLEESCENLMSERGDFSSDDCEEFEQAAKDAGIDTSGSKR